MKNYPTIVCAEEVPALLKAGCQMPDCKHDEHGELVIGQRCHPGAGLAVFLLSEDHEDNPLTKRPVIKLLCNVCRKPVGGVLIGKEGK